MEEVMFRMTLLYLFIVSTVIFVMNVAFAGEATEIVGESYRDGLIETVTVGAAEEVKSPEENQKVIEATKVGSADVIKNVVNFAKENAKCLASNIPGRGRVESAPGAFYGLTVTMARSVCRTALDPIKQAMMNGVSTNKDVFRYYGLDRSSEKNTMVNLYGLLLAHVFQETSGKFWEGVDITNQSSNKANTAEAGLCQTSNNIHNFRSGREGMKAVVAQYDANRDLCLTDVFSEGMSVRTGRAVIGEGEGARFQRLMRSCPAAALEHCAIAVRHVRHHYGPLNRKTSQALPACKSTFEKVYEYTKENRDSVCPQLGISAN